MFPCDNCIFYVGYNCQKKHNINVVYDRVLRTEAQDKVKFMPDICKDFRHKGKIVSWSEFKRLLASASQLPLFP